MRVLLLVSELEDFTIAFANGLVGHADVLLAVPRRRYARLKAAIDPRIDLRLLDWPRHRDLANPRFLLALTRLVRAERPDVIHLLSHTVVWLNLALPFWRPMPIVTTVHDVELHPGDTDTSTIPRWCGDLACRLSGDVVVHGEALARRATARFNKAPERVHVLPHPAIGRYADLARAEGMTRRETPGVFTVLMFGRLFSYKGLDVLLRAEALLAGRVAGLRIVLAGRGDDPWALQPLMGDPSRYDVRNRFVGDREVAQLFLDADLVALPYREASQSGVLNVAAAFGRPVVASDVGELGCTVRDHGLGALVPPGDPERLAEAIADLAERPDRLAAFGRAARAWAKGPNAPATVGAQAATLYRQIAAGAATAKGAPLAGDSPALPG
ncbi:glycosyltransferase family 4 protein [Antarcticirhabdus aurantiaca]|uniref:glycosyltransferase family 4 protein n=1 Tax=Antarcticirhabdus aurantiaca TaxID=2606717 RepID=UPI00131D5FAE